MENANIDLVELMRGRRTYRRFDELRPVPEECIRDMAEAFRLSSSAGNLQLLRCAFVTNPALVREIFPMTGWAAYLPREVGTPKPGQRPAMFALLLCDPSQKARWLDTDAGIAMANLTLAAWRHGVGSCIMANIDRAGIARALNLPDDCAVHAAIALGYPTHRSRVTDLPEDGSIRYTIDENGDYSVPKRSVDALVRRFD